MTMTRDNRTGLTVLAGVALISLGAWILFRPLLAPFAALFSLVGRIGWPLLLIGLGILFIIRARGGGFTVAGKKLVRSRSNRMVGGVIAGLADYVGVDATILRVIYAFVTLFTGIVWGVLLYFLAMIIVPEENYPADWIPAPAPSVPTPPRPAPPVPQSPTAPTPPPAAAPTPPPAAAPTPPPAPAPAPTPPAAPAPTGTEPPQAPPIPSEPTIL
jgi:phage shock protein PspC (stress-responsive transcriptional regulator)